MIKKHRDFKDVPEDVVIWKYMSLEKFLFLIRERKLHFQRLDCFEDNAEGTLSVMDRRLFHVKSKEDEEYFKNERRRNYVCCWIESKHELALMWNTYGNKGVAIKSTIGLLKKAMEIDSCHTLYLSKVNY